MSGTINLRQVRKQRQRAEKRAQADANAAKFGESKPIRAARAAETARAARDHDAHKRDDD